MNEGMLAKIVDSGEHLYTQEHQPIIRRGNVAVSKTIKSGDLLARDSSGKIQRFARSQSGSPAADVDIGAADAVTIVGIALEDITTESTDTGKYVEYLAHGCINGTVQVGGSDTALKQSEKDALCRVGLFVN